MRRLLSGHPPVAVRRGGAVLALAGVLGLTGVPPAAAHSGLEDGSPGPGDEVATGVTSVGLQLEGVDPDGEHEVVLLDEQDRALATGEAVAVDETTVCAAVDPMVAGVHAVEYSLTADDGHVVLGRYLFEIVPGAGQADDLGCDAAELPQPQAAEALGLDTDTPPVWLLAGLGGLLVLSAGAATAAVVRSRRAGGSAGDPTDEDVTPRTSA